MSMLFRSRLPYLKTSKTDFSRRRFLRYLGVGAGLTLLDPTSNPFVFAAEALSFVPRRFVFVLEGNGAEPVNFLSQEGRAALNVAADARWFHQAYPTTSAPLVYETDFSTAPGLSLLGDGHDLIHKSAVVLGLSSLITGGGHTAHHGALGCSRSSTGSPGGRTIDAFLAQLPKVRQASPFDAIRLGISGTSQSLNYDTCAYDVGKAAALILDPVLAFDSLFGSATSLGEADFAARTKMLEFGMADVDASLSLFSIGSAERAKLEGYYQALTNLKERQSVLLSKRNDLLTHLPPLPTAPGSATSPNYYTSQLNGYDLKLDRLRAQFHLAESALKSGLTNVVVIGSGTGTAHFNVLYPSINQSVARHELHHKSSYDSDLVQDIHAVTHQHLELTINLAKALDLIPEGNGTMLDHTIIVFMSDNGEQHHSTGSDWPLLVMGGGALGLRTGGRTLIYPHINYEIGRRQVSNFFNTLGYCAEQNLNDFGKEGVNRFHQGPLQELLT
ncbi:MAG: hypothetical protein CMH56_00100 [Myxococcales bacterium]|nr:hypothetical protein [Myxococcales bacterium]|tara:strand:- start:1024 stop:2526 length:1503 start_codon:yes stop_codon:yes gene_type:complete